MEITPALLIYLGFEALPDRPDTYSYKGITGRLVDELGLFYFLGFSQPIARSFKLTLMRLRSVGEEARISLAI